MRIRSVLGVGTTVVVRLPLKVPQVAFREAKAG
jgi:hypothetical protein